MTTNVVYTLGNDDKVRKGAVVDLAHGVFSPFAWFPVAYANDLSVSYGAASAAGVTAGHFEQLKRDCALQAARLGKVFVDINDADVPKIAAQ